MAVILRYLSSTIIIVIMLNHLQGAMRTGGVGPAVAKPAEEEAGREGGPLPLKPLSGIKVLFN